MDTRAVEMVQAPPTRIGGILSKLGPGLIIAGSIVGSGELIGTTKTGAEAGFWLLWLIIIGCVIKVFVQVEFGRYTIVSGQATMACMNAMPGPAIRVGAWRGNWLMWYWLAMFLISLGQLGGIVGGVGEALAISMPLTDAGKRFNETQDRRIKLRIAEAQQSNLAKLEKVGFQGTREQFVDRQAELRSTIDQLKQSDTGGDLAITKHPDVKIWAAITTAATIVLLVVGRYWFIERFTTLLVAGFTFATVANVIALQGFDDWAVRWRDLVEGLSFRLPPPDDERGITRGLNPLATALATFGIIGVGANELISYPYFCLEKGYARFTGPRDSSSAWAARANGWLRVLRWDAWCSMVVYTLATLAFYFLGAAILGRIGLVPENDDLIRTLLVMYEPVFGAWALWLFLFGAFAVLYSTFFVANAGHARTVTDAIFVLSGAADDPARRHRWIKLFCVIFPTIAFCIYAIFPNPVQLVLLSGAMQAIMLPMLSATAIYFRYRGCDPRVTPGKLWDAALWLSAAGMLVAGGYLVIMQLPKWSAMLGG